MQGVIFVGLQASGKSTFYAQQFFQTHIRLNLDMLKTRHREKLLLQACLQAKQPVVIDNTNSGRAQRQHYIEAMADHRFQIHGYYFQSSLADCLARNRLRAGKARIPDAGIRSTLSKLELPSYTEGFDQLYFVSMADSQFKVEAWRDEIR